MGDLLTNQVSLNVLSDKKQCLILLENYHFYINIYKLRINGVKVDFTWRGRMLTNCKLQLLFIDNKYELCYNSYSTLKGYLCHFCTYL